LFRITQILILDIFLAELESAKTHEMI